MEFSEEKASKLEQNVIKSLNDLNKKLHTNLTFYMVLEEISFLKRIPTTKGYGLRLDHFDQVTKRWYKGILDEHRDSSNRGFVKRLTVEKINAIYTTFIRELLEYLYFIKVLAKRKNGGIENSEELSDEKKSNELRIFEIEQAIKILGLYQRQLDNSSLALENRKDEELKKETIDKKSLIDIDEITIKNPIKVEEKPKSTPLLKKEYNYYGPSTLYIHDPFIKRLIETFSENNSLDNIKYVNQVSIIKKSDNVELDKAHKLLVYAQAYKYRFDQLEGERKRLYAERLNLQRGEDSFDFYFDSFIWRTLNDMLYLVGNISGGIKAVIDLLTDNILEKNALDALETKNENLIEVNIDELNKDELDNVLNELKIQEQKKEFILENVINEPIIKK